jgi:hypothetical protein
MDKRLKTVCEWILACAFLFLAGYGFVVMAFWSMGA